MRAESDATAKNASVRLYRGKPISRFHVMIKPTGPVCNLDCAYCYYLSKQDLLGSDRDWRISDDTLEEFTRQYIAGQNCKEIIFSWQGGEPTLLGLDFFRRAVALQKKYAPKHVRCENDLQTNGTLLTDEWCEFLREERFLVGLSIDGPRALHDRYRKDRSGAGSFDRVLQASKLLRRHEVNFATLSCVNRLTAQHPLEVYRFLRDELGSHRMQFIPIVEPKAFRHVAPQHENPADMPYLDSSAARPGTEDSVVEDWCIDPSDWGQFLCEVFDEWYRRDVGAIYINYFEAAVESWMGHVNPLCTLAPMCGKGLAVEHNGDVYSCDHYVYPEFRLGNVHDTPVDGAKESLASMAFSEQQTIFGKSKEGRLPRYCRQCEYLFACFGECPKNRLLRAPDGEAGLNYLCSGWKQFFSHINPSVAKLVRAMGQAVVKEAQAPAAESWQLGAE